MSEQMNASRARAAQSMTSEAHQTAAREASKARPEVGQRYEVTYYTGHVRTFRVTGVWRNSVWLMDERARDFRDYTMQDWQAMDSRRIE